MDEPMFLRFVLDRRVDETGVSGAGVVAEGIQFSSGKVVLGWCTKKGPNSLTFWDSIDEVLMVHGHDGKTSILWVD